MSALCQIPVLPVRVCTRARARARECAYTYTRYDDNGVHRNRIAGGPSFDADKTRSNVRLSVTVYISRSFEFMSL